MKYLILTISTLLLTLTACPVFAQIMESNNYRLESEEINMGAIGEMRDFSAFNQREGPALGIKLKDGLNSSLIWVLLSVIAGTLLLLVFVFGKVKGVNSKW